MKYFYSISIVLILAVLGYNSYVIHFNSEKKVLVYVRINDVFDAFELKKEMEQKYSDETKNSGRYLDSLAFEIQRLSETKRLDVTSAEYKKVEDLKSLYYQKRSYYENFAVELTQTYDQQILTQMKQYIHEYGVLHNCKYILSQGTDGVVLYGEEMSDKTEEVITFINQKYQGE